jgi:N-acyl-D-aspartate/D-glutamate deacylase
MAAKRISVAGVLAILALVGTVVAGNPQPPAFDILILSGLVVDGTGGPGYQADVGIRGGLIVEIGDLDEQSASTLIDAEGKVVSPGFIDMHTHCDGGLGNPESSANLNYLSQGTTTVVTGNCGGSVSLGVSETKRVWEEQGIGTNVVYLIGHGTVRRSVMGAEPREATAREIEQMQELVRKAMGEGAWGISTGLEYVPGRYASTDEVIAVTSVVAEFGGVYTTHMRNEAGGIVDALNETVRIGRETGVPVNVGHLKVTGKDNWGLMDAAIEVFREARAGGVAITADQYPYIQSAPIGLLYTFVEIPNGMAPFAGLRRQLRNRELAAADRRSLQRRYARELSRALADSSKREQIRELTLVGRPNVPSAVAMWGWHDFAILVSTRNSELVGTNFTELPREPGQDLFDVVVELIIDEPDILYGGGSQSAEEHARALSQDWVMVSSDGGAEAIVDQMADPVRGHPRDFGSQARVLRKFVREDGLLTLEAAIRKMSSLPAEFLQLNDRGLLREGYAADLVVFDPERIWDNATYGNSRQYPSGVAYVIVNGRVSIDSGHFGGALNGRVLLLTDYR